MRIESQDQNTTHVGITERKKINHHCERKRKESILSNNFFNSGMNSVSALN